MIDSVKKRYFYKLFTNIISFIINLLIGGILPRGLGVENLGNFNFITNFFNQIIQLLDFRTSTCFYTKLSQNPDNNKLIVFYSYFSYALFLIISVIVVVIILTPLKAYLLPEQKTSIIIYSFLFVLITWVTDVLVKIMDAKGLTLSLERIRVINKIISSLTLILLYITNLLNLIVYFFYSYLFLFLMIFLFFRSIKKTGHPIILLQHITRRERKGYRKSFIRYSSPLAVYLILAFISITFERWLLQLYGGSLEQGLYSFSFMLISMTFIFFNSLTPIFTRELSVAAGKNDICKMGALYRQYVPMLYAITAFFSCFIFINAESLIKIFGGNDYKDALLTLKIFSFYPLVSVYSNLNGSVIYANGQTRVFMILSMIFIPMGMIITYLLIGQGRFCYELGAEGLAIKVFLMELISVFIILKINTKFLGLKYSNYVIHAVFSIVPFLILSYVTHSFVMKIVNVNDSFMPVIFSFLLKGILYSIFSFILIIYFPKLFGLSKSEINDQIINIKKYFNL